MVRTRLRRAPGEIGSMKPRKQPSAHSLSISDLVNGPAGGKAILNLKPREVPAIGQLHSSTLNELMSYEFWRRSVDQGQYRPDRGLWLPQLRAISFGNAYLAAARVSRDSAADPAKYRMDEAALVKMPTGTGKTAVIATLACCSPLSKKALVITPRAALVRQMKFDLSFRFWQKLDALYCRYSKDEGYQLHEAPTPEQRDLSISEIRNGKQAPIRVFESESYEQIYAERNGNRQILVSTFNALHLVLGIPCAHRSTC